MVVGEMKIRGFELMTTKINAYDIEYLKHGHQERGSRTEIGKPKSSK